MADLTDVDTYMKNLRNQAATLTETALSLISVFAEEANRLNRQDEASRLNALHSSIGQQLHQVRRSEDSAEYGHVQADVISSLGGLALGGIVKRVSKNKRLSSFADYLLESPNNKQRPFGNVLVCIGPEGLPDDVRVVPISRLARESNQEEPEVINELREHGYLLLSEKAFSLLIEKLVDDVQEGRLRLPISLEKLPEVRKLNFVRLEPENLS